MKVKFNPVVYIFVIYLCLSAYLIFSYFNLRQYLSSIEVVDLTPVAFGLLILSSNFLALSLFSLFRIPIFHYLFKMIHLWIVVLSGVILWLYFEHGNMLSDMFNANTQQSIANIFPVTHPDMFDPIINLIQSALNNLKDKVIYLYLVATIILAIIQIILYMPASLRHVYHTHVGPIKYTLKHIFFSLLLLALILYAANYYFKLDSSLNPELESLLAENEQSINDTNNVFYPMLTLWLPEITDSISYGKQWVTEHKNMLAYFKNINKPVNPLEYPRYRKLLLGGMSKTDQAAINQLYIKRLLKSDAKLDEEIDKYIKQYQMEINTIRSFYKYDHYDNPINYTEQSYTQFYSDYAESLLSLQRLNLLASSLAHDLSIKSIIKNISDEYMFNLRVMNRSNDSKVKFLYMEKQGVIVQFLYNLVQNSEFQHNDVYHFINQLPILAKQVIDQKLIARKNIILVKNQLDLANKNLSNNQSSTAKIIEYTFKYNKTLNCIYAQAIREYNLDNKEISAHMKRRQSVITKSSLDNLIGNIICSASIPNHERDIYIKAVEVNGSIMILKARSKLYEDQINDVNIAAYLTNHSGEYYNPFTGGALQWDRDAKQIYFKYTNDKENIKVSH